VSVQHGPTWPGPVCQCGYEPNGWAPDREDYPRPSLYQEAQDKARAQAEAALARHLAETGVWVSLVRIWTEGAIALACVAALLWLAPLPFAAKVTAAGLMPGVVVAVTVGRALREAGRRHEDERSAPRSEASRAAYYRHRP
jgi:hypothetical protein